MSNTQPSDKEQSVSKATRLDILDARKKAFLPWFGRLPSLKDMISDLSFKYLFLEIDPLTPRGLYEAAIESSGLKNDTDSVLLQLEDGRFLEFLCQTIHPNTRSNTNEVQILLRLYNDCLKNDGYEIVEAGNHEAGRPVFTYTKINIESIISDETDQKISRPRIKEIIDTCRQQMKQKEFSNVIKDAHVLLDECVLDVYRQKTGTELRMPKGCNFNKKFQKLASELENQQDELSRSVLKQFKDVVNNLCAIRNRKGGVHPQKEDAMQQDAKLVLNSTITIIDYLYDLV